MQNSTDTLVDEASFVNKKLVTEKVTSIKQLNTDSQDYLDEVFVLNQHKSASNTGFYIHKPHVVCII